MRRLSAFLLSFTLASFPPQAWPASGPRARGGPAGMGTLFPIVLLKAHMDAAIGETSVYSPVDGNPGVSGLVLAENVPALARMAVQSPDFAALHMALGRGIAQDSDLPALPTSVAWESPAEETDAGTAASSRFSPLPLVSSILQQLRQRQGQPLDSLAPAELAGLSARLLRAYDNARSSADPGESLAAAGRVMDAAGSAAIGNCHRNIRDLVELLQGDPTFDLGKAKVLFLTRPVEYEFADPLEPNMALLGVRGEGSEAAVFHTVLEFGGRIYDPSSEEGRHGIPAREYFDRTFLLNPGRRIKVDGTRSAPMQERLRLQIARNAFRDRDELYAQLRVRPMDAREYLSRHASEIDEHRGELVYFWEGMEASVPSLNLGHYLEPRSKARPYARAPRPDWDRRRTVSFEGLRVSFNEEALMVGDLQQVGNAVTAERAGKKHREVYNRTDRGLDVMPWLFPARMLDLDRLRGRVVLDATAGGGLFVEELREKGVPAYGLDIALNRRQRRNLLADTRRAKGNSIILPASLAAKAFLWGDAAATRIADQQVDAVYDTQGIFAYEFFGDRSGVRKIVEEWRRILKIGGVIRFAPIDESYEDEVRAFFAGIPGLAVTDIAPPAKGDSFDRAVEITRIF